MKQYAIMDAYTDNYHVVIVDDGKIVGDDIVAYYELVGYTRALENQGYKKSYFLPEAAGALKAAEEEYKRAREDYEEALANTLQISDEEAKKCYCLKRFYGGEND